MMFIKVKSAKNDKSRKYIDGFGSFPDLAIFGENFPEGQEPKNVEEGENTILKNIYGCVEAKSTGSKLIKCLDHNTMEIGYKEEENDNYVQNKHSERRNQLLCSNKHGENFIGGGKRRW
ncbi:hypothetical protein [Blautia stercoris]